MEKQVRVLSLGLIVVMAGGSSALALAPLGPPTAGLNQRQLRLGGEYSYGETDLDIDGDTLNNVESSMIFGNLAYGITDTWEAYLRLGAASTEFDVAVPSYAWPEEVRDVFVSDAMVFPNVEFDGDYEFAYGLGTKCTFATQPENLHWGAMLLQNDGRGRCLRVGGILVSA